MSVPEERMRILKLIESGQISAEEGARLIEAFESETARVRQPPSGRPRSLRVLVTDLGNRRPKVNVTIPVSLVNIGLKLGARLFPHSGGSTGEDVRRAIESGETGRIFDWQDLEENERVEIFIET